jgi:hypothetical protein
VQKILRVVIDTNLIMSAILSSRGASAKLIDWMTKEEDCFRLLISQPIWDEYSTVADWLIPESRQGEKERILHILRLQSDWIEPKIHWRSAQTNPTIVFWSVLLGAKQITLSRKTFDIFHQRNTRGSRSFESASF